MTNRTRLIFDLLEMSITDGTFSAEMGSYLRTYEDIRNNTYGTDIPTEFITKLAMEIKEGEELFPTLYMDWDEYRDDYLKQVRML